MQHFNGWLCSKKLVSSITALLISGAVCAGAGEDSVAERIRPIGKVNVAPTVIPLENAVIAPVAPATAITPAVATTPAPAPEANSAHEGKKIYDKVCFSCHDTGVAKAPKPGDKEAWAPRVAKGEAALLESSINGKPPMMPPRGTCGTCSDADLKAAVQYMTSQSK